jgi:hypothetical protein
VNMSELHIMKFDKVMTKTDKSNWDEAVIQEHNCMTDHKAWEELDQNESQKALRSLQALGL